MRSLRHACMRDRLRRICSCTPPRTSAESGARDPPRHVVVDLETITLLPGFRIAVASASELFDAMTNRPPFERCSLHACPGVLAASGVPQHVPRIRGRDLGVRSQDRKLGFLAVLSTRVHRSTRAMDRTGLSSRGPRTSLSRLFARSPWVVVLTRRSCIDQHRDAVAVDQSASQQCSNASDAPQTRTRDPAATWSVMARRCPEGADLHARRECRCVSSPWIARPS